MNKNNNHAWKTKYGSRRVRQEAPTLDEALVAAQGLTDDTEAQVEIAASLIGLPSDQVRSALRKTMTPRKDVLRSITPGRASAGSRSIVVERKPVRRTLAAGRTQRPAPGSSRGPSMRDY